MFVEQHTLLTMACHAQLVHAGATVAGPVATVAQVLNLLGKGDIDAAIVDIEIDVETLMHLASLLDAMHVPFVFVLGKESLANGFVLSDDRNQLREIADALFGAPGPSSTLH